MIRSFKCHPSQLNAEALFHHRNFLQALESYDELRRTQRKQSECLGLKLCVIFVEMQLKFTQNSSTLSQVKLSAP